MNIEFKDRKLNLIYEAAIDPLLFLLMVGFGHALWHILFPSLTLESKEVFLFDRFIITPFTLSIQRFLSNQHYLIAHWLNPDVQQNGLTVYIPGRIGSYMAWGCVGVKQMMIFVLSIVFSRGRHVHKTWFIPLGVVVLHGVNLVRITILFFISSFHIEYFELMHDQILKIMFYVIIFFIWLVWQHRFNPKYNSLLFKK